jgi:hypothetical protein
MNWRIKPLDDILANAERRSLKRSLGGFQLTMMGVGAIIGTGIFVLTAEAAQKAGPGMMVSFIIAGFVCAVAALCYAELASMVPVSGSAYTYSYAVMGEVVAWVVGWALVLEYAVAASAVSVGWSNYFVGLMDRSLGISIPEEFTRGPYAGGVMNVPAATIALLVTSLLIVGTRESASVNAVLVAIKVAALTQRRQLRAVCTEWILGRNGPRYRRCRRVDLLCLRGLRCGLDRSRRNRESATQHPDRFDRQSRDLHDFLHAGRCRCDRLGWCPAGARCRWSRDLAGQPGVRGGMRSA